MVSMGWRPHPSPSPHLINGDFVPILIETKPIPISIPIPSNSHEYTLWLVFFCIPNFELEQFLDWLLGGHSNTLSKYALTLIKLCMPFIINTLIIIHYFLWFLLSKTNKIDRICFSFSIRGVEVTPLSEFSR